MKPLVIPPAAQIDPRAVQMLSAWIAERGLHCSLKIGMWQESGRPEAPAWGILLADTVRHIARALQEAHGLDQADTSAAILDSLERELAKPTSPVTGSFHAGHS